MNFPLWKRNFNSIVLERFVNRSVDRIGSFEIANSWNPISETNINGRVCEGLNPDLRSWVFDDFAILP